MGNNGRVISIDSAAVMLATSKRTLWRWLHAGTLRRVGTDERRRVMLDYAEVAPRFCVSLATVSASGESDADVLLAADRGDSEAQNTLGLLLLEQAHADIALHWFTLAAEQGHMDAMHYLSELYQQGLGVAGCQSTAMLWRAKAATAGHAIARAQLAGITGADQEGALL